MSDLDVGTNLLQSNFIRFHQRTDIENTSRSPYLKPFYMSKNTGYN